MPALVDMLHDDAPHSSSAAAASPSGGRLARHEQQLALADEYASTDVLRAWLRSRAMAPLLVAASVRMSAGVTFAYFQLRRVSRRWW